MAKPLITTDIPGCRETVEDGINGFLCVPKDTNSLIQAILKFINMPPAKRIQMGIEGRKKAEKEFDIREVIKVYHSITQPYES